jgi:hypothetical protein
MSGKVAAIGLVVAVLCVPVAIASAPSSDANVATCDQAVIGHGPAGWKRRALIAGPVGVFRHPLSQMSRTGNGQYVAKMPLVVEGHAPVGVSVPPPLRHRVFLYYGRVLDSAGHPTTSFAAPGYAETRFEPCDGRPRTPWPGGIRIKGTAPVHLTVRAEGSDEAFQLRLGRPHVYRSAG